MYYFFHSFIRPEYVIQGYRISYTGCYNNFDRIYYRYILWNRLLFFYLLHENFNETVVLACETNRTLEASCARLERLAKSRRALCEARPETISHKIRQSPR